MKISLKDKLMFWSDINRSYVHKGHSVIEKANHFVLGTPVNKSYSEITVQFDHLKNVFTHDYENSRLDYGKLFILSKDK